MGTVAAESAQSVTRREQLLSIVERLRESLRLPTGIAAALRGKVFGLSLLGLGAGAWLAFFCWQALRPGWLAASLLTLVLLTPGLALYVIQYLLVGVAQLPQRLDACVASLDGNVKNYQGARDVARGRRKISWGDLRQMIRAVRELRDLAGESQELLTLTGRALAVMNPLFLLALAGGSLLTLLLTLAGLVTLPVYLWG